MATTRYASNDTEVDALYADAAAKDVQPLWEMKGILTPQPLAKAIPFRWRLADLMDLGHRAQDLIPIDRGGDRRVLAFANPGLQGAPYVQTHFGPLRSFWDQGSSRRHTVTVRPRCGLSWRVRAFGL